MAKRIGIVGYGGKELFGAGLAYLDFLSNYGEVTIILPQHKYVEGLDMLFLPGGPDLNPFSYNEVPGFYTSSACPYRQFFFDKRLKNYIGKTSVFGVCLGFQMLSCFFGGKLIQNIEDHELDKGDMHQIFDANGAPLTYRRGKKEYLTIVGSSHHQGIKKEILGEGFEILAQSKEGYVECIRNKELKLAGIQWHCERTYTDLADSLIKELLN